MAQHRHFAHSHFIGMRWPNGGWRSSPDEVLDNLLNILAHWAAAAQPGQAVSSESMTSAFGTSLADTPGRFPGCSTGRRSAILPSPGFAPTI
jgi:hypothetical protein